MQATTDLSARHEALRASGTLNPHPERVVDALFCAGAYEPNLFFDAHDLVQVKYEMLRRVRIERVSVSAAAAAFGFSRVTWYHLESRYDSDGMAGLLPQTRGPKPQTKKRSPSPGVQTPGVKIPAPWWNWSDSMKSCASRC